VIYASGERQAISAACVRCFAAFCARGTRPRCLRQRQPHEICRESPRRHQQRRERRGDGAGLKAGLDARTVFEMVTSGAANSRVFELRAPMMVRDRYDDPSMKISVWQKDMAVIGEFARSLRCPTPMFDATVPIYDKAMRGGHAEQTPRRSARCRKRWRASSGEMRSRAPSGPELPRAPPSLAQKIEHRGLSQHGFRDAVALRALTARRRSAWPADRHLDAAHAR
jgi:hypothetical protein